MVWNIFYLHPYLEKIPILTNIFQMGWNHQPASNGVFAISPSPNKNHGIRLQWLHPVFGVFVIPKLYRDHPVAQGGPRTDRYKWSDMGPLLSIGTDCNWGWL